MNFGNDNGQQPNFRELLDYELLRSINNQTEMLERIFLKALEKKELQKKKQQENEENSAEYCETLRKSSNVFFFLIRANKQKKPVRFEGSFLEEDNNKDSKNSPFPSSTNKLLRKRLAPEGKKIHFNYISQGSLFVQLICSIL